MTHLYGSGTKPTHSPRDGKKPTKPFLEDKCSARPADSRTYPQDPRALPRAYGPRTHQGLSYKLYFASHQYLQDFTGHRILRLPRTLWEHKLSSHQETCPSHCRRIHVLWCSLEHKTFRILKPHGQSPLGCKVSSCSIYYIFVLFI